MLPLIQPKRTSRATAQRQTPRLESTSGPICGAHLHMLAPLPGRAGGARAETIAERRSRAAGCCSRAVLNAPYLVAGCTVCRPWPSSSRAWPAAARGHWLGSVGLAVTSDTRDLRFNSGHLQSLLTIDCIKTV